VHDCAKIVSLCCVTVSSNAVGVLLFPGLMSALAGLVKEKESV
jgi:hypothetical protein